MQHHNTEASETDGGNSIKPLNEIRHTDDLVREYSADGRLYAYRDGDRHVVVSEGKEPQTNWVKTIPSTVKRPVPNQKRWTIPDNWEERVRSIRDNIAYSLFYVPESDVWAKVSIPTNNHLVDAWYRVKTVGNLVVNPVGELANQDDVRNLAENLYHDGNPEFIGESGIIDIICELANEWEWMEGELHAATKWVRDEGLDTRGGTETIRLDGDWEIEFYQDRIFKPREVIQGIITHSEYDISPATINDILRDGDLLPSSYKFKLGIDNSDTGMQYHIRSLIEATSSPTAAIDYYMIEIQGLSQSEWANERQVEQPSVSENVASVKNVLED